MNNPMQMIMQMMMSGNNPQQLVNQLMNSNPQMRTIANQMKSSGMSSMEFLQQYAKQKGVDVNPMIETLSKRGINLK